jgi:hypothetical protein
MLEAFICGLVLGVLMYLSEVLMNPERWTYDYNGAG